MPRIPESEVARLKAEVSLERLAEAKGVKLIRKGADLHGRCPFHADRTPSLVITPEKNIWNCLGACQAGGSVVDWVMKAQGVSFRHAVELLKADLVGTVPGPVSSPAATTTAPKLPPLVRSGVEDQVLLRRVVGYYHETLRETPEALEYLRSRGLGSSELVSHFQLGFADRTLGYRLPEKTRKEGAEIRGRLSELGVLRKSGHEHLCGSLVVPLFDAAGNVVQMYGRKIRSDLRKGTPSHLYLPGKKSGVLNREALAASPEVILCESILDAFTFWVAGLRNVTTLYGAGGVHEELWEAFGEAGTRRVLLAFDRDAAGDAAAEKVAAELTARGIAAYRVELPRGQDVNEYAAKVQPARQALELVVRHAKWLGEGEAPIRTVTGDVLEVASPQATEEEDEEPRHATKEEGGEGAATSEDEPDAGTIPPPAPLPLVASSAPSLLERHGDDVVLKLGDRTYQVRGLWRNSSPTSLKVNLRVKRESWGAAPPPPGSFHMETLDLYLGRPREGFVKKAATLLGHEESVLERDMAQLLFELEGALEDERAKASEPKERTVPLTGAERDEALDLLRSPDLLLQILADFEACGVVGEETNKLAGYLAATSRKLERPLAIVVQSNSAAGKSSLMDAVLSFMPEEEQVCYSAMTGQSLFYMADADLKHKILAVAEEEGAQRASYALKLLQSEGQLTIASTGKDPVSGRLVTEDYKVEGPVMLFLTTTATDVDEELMNRCLVLAVDEGLGQTQAIQQLQRSRLAAGCVRDARTLEGIRRRHKNAQRLLKAVQVVNPYASQLTFPSHQTRFRRDHMKYLHLISTVALLHQYQRERKRAVLGGVEVEYVEVLPDDVAVANSVAHQILGHSVDELSPQTRHFLRQLVGLVEARATEQGISREEYRFTRRDVREWTGAKDNRVHAHLTRLEELEYVLVHSGRRGKSIVYELLFDGDPEEGSQHFSGLVDAAMLRLPGEETRGYDPGYSVGFRPLFGANSVGSRSDDQGESPPETLSRSTSLSSLLEKLSFPRKPRPGAGEEADPVVVVGGTPEEIQ